MCEASGELPRARAIFFRCFQAYRRTLRKGHGFTKLLTGISCVASRASLMKRHGERLEDSQVRADAKVNLGDGCWRDAMARHVDANLWKRNSVQSQYLRTFRRLDVRRSWTAAENPYCKKSCPNCCRCGTTVLYCRCGPF